MKGFRDLQNRNFQLEEMGLSKEIPASYTKLKNKVHSMLGYKTDPGRKKIDVIKHIPKAGDAN